MFIAFVYCLHEYILFFHLGWNLFWRSIFLQMQAVAMSKSLKLFSTLCPLIFHRLLSHLIAFLICAKPVIQVYQLASKSKEVNNDYCGAVSLTYPADPKPAYMRFSSFQR